MERKPCWWRRLASGRLPRATGDPGDVVMTRESAVAANIYALIGQIERGEHPHGFPEMLKGGRLG